MDILSVLVIRALILAFGFVQAGLCGISGDWQGVLDYPAGKLVLVLHLKGADEDLVATVDSPLQGLYQVPADYVNFHDDELRLRITQWKVQFAGELDDGAIRGAFSQIGQPHLPLTLKRIEPSSSRIPENLAGAWSGTVEGPAGPVRMSIHVSSAAIALDIPDQAIAGFHASSITVAGDEIRFELPPPLFASYQGKVAGEEIRGTFSQYNYSLPLILKNTGGQKQ